MKIHITNHTFCTSYQKISMLAIVFNEINITRNTAKNRTGKELILCKSRRRGIEFLDVSLSSIRYITSYVQSSDRRCI